MAYIIIIGLLITADQLSKHLLLHYLGEYANVYLTPFLNIALAYNKGAAWSFLADWDFGIYLLTIVSAFFLLFLIYWWYKQAGQFNVYLQSCLALIIAGGSGNLIDRLLLRKVIDFIDFHWATYHFPTFNVADSCLTLGVFLLFFFVLIKKIDLQKVLE